MGEKRIYTVDGFTGCIAEMAVHFNKRASSIYGYLRNGLSIEDAIEKATTCPQGEDPKSQRSLTKLYTVNGFTGTFGEIAAHFGVNASTLQGRINRGIPIEKAVLDISVVSGDKLETSFERKPYSKRSSTVYTVRGFTGTISEIAKYFGINQSTLRSRIYRGDSIEYATSYTVDKLRSCKIPSIKEIGKFRGTVRDVKGRFGIYTDFISTIKSEELISYIQSPEVVTFYNIDGFKGTLSAIAEKYSVSKFNLEKCVKQGIEIKNYLKEQGKIEC